jgi:flagellar hook assembly protein FlgD
VYNTSGQIVAQYTQQTHDQGNTHHTFTWNARTLNGQRLAAGVYPYKIQVHTSTNEQATFSGKLTIAP